MQFSYSKDIVLESPSYANIIASNDALDINGGAKLELYSISNCNDYQNDGSFKLSARKKDGNYIELVGNGDGLLTWNGLPLSTSNINFDNTYLKLNGSNKMTGHIYVNNYSLKSFTIGYPYADKIGALLSVRSINYETDTLKGSFALGAINGENEKFLTGRPDGVLTWNGKTIVSVQTPINQTLYSSTGTGGPSIEYNNGTEDGGCLYLFNKSDTTYKGGFILRARAEDGSIKDLKGSSDGKLTWNGKNVLTEENGVVVVGEIKWFSGATVPSGYLVCNGSTVSRTTYAALYSAIGTKWGAGNGSTTFTLPNLIDRVPWGSSTAGTYKSAGLPNHNHDVGFGHYQTGAYGERTISTAKALSGYGSAPHLTLSSYTSDASDSNTIYGASSTVQPPAATLIPIIKY